MHLILASADSDSSGGGAALVILLIIFALAIVAIVGVWKVFTKAGEAGWKSLIPIWNTVVILRIAGRPVWWVVLMIIPFVNFIAWIFVANDLRKSFGKGDGFAVGLVLLPMIFLCILGFGDARYLGPAGPEGAGAMSSTPPPPPPPPPPPA